jgi:hypothetical protein
MAAFYLVVGIVQPQDCTHDGFPAWTADQQSAMAPSWLVCSRAAAKVGRRRLPRRSRLDSNPSLLIVEPVSVRCANSGREKVRRGQRPDRDFWRQLRIPRDRDSPLPRLSRRSLGKLKTIPEAPRNRICGGLGGGAGRTRTCKQTTMSAATAAREATFASAMLLQARLCGRRAQRVHKRIPIGLA